MINRLKDWLAEQQERRRYYNVLAFYPTEILCMITFGVVYLADKFNFFPMFFNAIGVVIMLLATVYRLFIYVAAKHRPDDWDKF